MQKNNVRITADIGNSFVRKTYLLECDILKQFQTGNGAHAHFLFRLKFGETIQFAFHNIRQPWWWRAPRHCVLFEKKFKF